MDWMWLLEEIFRVAIIPLIAVLVGVAIKYIRIYFDTKTAATDNEISKKYMQMLKETIVNCVLATNQTYVDALKEKQIFDEEAQKEAFRLTFEAVKAILSADAMKYLTEIYGDLDAYIKAQIESTISENNQKKKELAA